MSRLPHLPLVPLAIAAALAVIGYLAFSTVTGMARDYRLRNDEAQVQRDIAQLDQDHDQLVAVRDYLNSDEYVEYIARRVLGLVKPGETLVIVSGPKPDPTATPAEGAGSTPEPEWWKNLFGGVRPLPTSGPSPHP